MFVVGKKYNGKSLNMIAVGTVTHKRKVEKYNLN
jgi:hypothetical protein